MAFERQEQHRVFETRRVSVAPVAELSGIVEMHVHHDEGGGRMDEGPLDEDAGVRGLYSKAHDTIFAAGFIAAADRQSC